jgi:hypothetical protein
LVSRYHRPPPPLGKLRPGSSDELVAAVLPKVDVQGGELRVLRGADGLLRSVDAALVEGSLVEL